MTSTLRAFKVLLIGFISLLLISCSSTEITGVWQEKDYNGGPLKKMTVIGVFQDDFIRKKIEDDFIIQGTKYNLTIDASYRAIPSDKLNSKEFIKKQIQASGADSLLITRVINKTVEETYIPGSTYISPHSSYYDWHNYYSRGYSRMHHPGYNSPMAYSTEIYQEPGQIVETEIYSLETNIYHMDNNKLLMTIKTDSAKDTTTDAIISSFTKTILQKMQAAGLISK